MPIYKHIIIKEIGINHFSDFTYTSPPPSSYDYYYFGDPKFGFWANRNGFEKNSIDPIISKGMVIFRTL